MLMLYHNFYDADIDWIKNQVSQKVALLNDSTPLYSGLFIPELPPDKMTRAIQVSLKHGAAGVCLFHANALSDAGWQSLEKIMNSRTIR